MGFSETTVLTQGIFPRKGEHSLNAGNSPKEEREESKKPGSEEEESRGFEFQRKKRVNPENFQGGSERVLLKKKPGDEVANWNLESLLYDAS